MSAVNCPDAWVRTERLRAEIFEVQGMIDLAKMGGADTTTAEEFVKFLGQQVAAEIHRDAWVRNRLAQENHPAVDDYMARQLLAESCIRVLGGVG